jgi:putative cell wall-binding protein
MEIHNHILNYLKGHSFSDINAEAQVRFNKLKLAKAEMANFLSNLKVLTADNLPLSQPQINVLRELSTSIIESVQVELDNLPSIEVKVLPAESSTYNQLSEKNKGKD